MKKFYYYARLNDNNICIEIVSRVTKLVDVVGYVEIPEYNETLRYKKWLGDQWSQDTYEPAIDTVLQDRMIAFESVVDSVQVANTGLVTQVGELNGNIMQLQGTIMELTMMLALLQGGM